MFADFSDASTFFLLSEWCVLTGGVRMTPFLDPAEVQATISAFVQGIPIYVLLVLFFNNLSIVVRVKRV